MAEAETDARRLATEARDRVRFEEEALGLADQVYRVARRLVPSREEAEDLVQETYARAFRSWRSYTPGTNLRAWLMRILTNLNIDRGRREQRAPDMQPMEEGDYFLYNRLEETSGPADEERIVERLSQDSIVEALSNVPHDFRDAIVLVDIGDFSYQEAAQILDVPIGTVMSRLHRGRRVLKSELAESAVGTETSRERVRAHLREVRGTAPAVPRPGIERNGAPGSRDAPRRVRVLRQAIPLRDQPAALRPQRVLLRGNVRGAEGEARQPPSSGLDSQPLRPTMTTSRSGSSPPGSAVVPTPSSFARRSAISSPPGG